MRLRTIHLADACSGINPRDEYTVNGNSLDDIVDFFGATGWFLHVDRDSDPKVTTLYTTIQLFYR
jgi:hypothetical protein